MIRRLTVVSFTLAILIGIFHSPVSAESKQDHKRKPVYYLSLGTSLAAGVQADPVTGEDVITDVSYPGELAEILSQNIQKFRHVNLGCSGESSESFIYGGKCGYPHGSQLDQAVRFLQTHAKHTGLITIDIGANDVMQCVDGTDIDPDCIADTLGQLSANLVYILKTLQEAAPGVPVVAMNYYNPLLVYWFTDQDLAAQTAGLQRTINSTLELVYSLYGVPVADVADAFMAYDLETDANENHIPDSVDLICLWTWMCTKNNIHANEEGYTVIAEQFFSILPEMPATK